MNNICISFFNRCQVYDQFSGSRCHVVSDQIFPSFIAESQITIVNLFDRFAIYFLRSSSISRRIYVFTKFIKDTFSRGNFINLHFLSRLYFSKFLVIFSSLSIIRRLKFSSVSHPFFFEFSFFYSRAKTPRNVRYVLYFCSQRCFFFCRLRLGMSLFLFFSAFTLFPRNVTSFFRLLWNFACSACFPLQFPFSFCHSFPLGVF